jgi:mannosyltransferase
VSAVRLALLPAAVAGALGLYQLGDPSLWVDEGFTFERTQFSYRHLMDDIQWAHFTLVKVWSEIAGTSEIALRFPSVVGAVASVVLLYLFTRRLFDQWVALVAALLLAVNPLVVSWSQQARAYTILVALVIATTWLLLRAVDRGTAIAWAGYGVLALVLIYWQTFSALVFLPVHAVVAWRYRQAWITWGLVLIAAIPWFIAFADREAVDIPTSWIPSPSAHLVVEFLRDASGAEGLGLLLALAGTAYAVRYRSLLVAWAMLPLALSLLISIFEPVFVARYLIVSTPGFAILVALAIVRVSMLARVAVVPLVVAGAAIGLYQWYSYDGSQNWVGEDWKSATAFVMQAGGATVSPRNALPTFEFYGGRHAETGWMLRRYHLPQPLRPGEVWFGERLRAARK